MEGERYQIWPAMQRDSVKGLEWSPGFFERLAAIDDDTGREVDELLKVVTSARKSKRPIEL